MESEEFFTPCSLLRGPRFSRRMGLARSRYTLVYICVYQSRWPNSTTIFGHLGFPEFGTDYRSKRLGTTAGRRVGLMRDRRSESGARKHVTLRR